MLLQLLFFLLLLAAVTVFPVMIAARIVHANRTGFGHALFALILQIVSSVMLALFIHFNSTFLLGLASWLIGSAVFALVMDTTFIKGMIISVLYVVIQVIILIFFGGMLGLHHYIGVGA